MGILGSRCQVVVVPLAVLALTGCANQAQLIVHTQPEGAYISALDSGQGYGMAPAVISYDEGYLNQHRDANGCYVLEGVEAKWASGAATTLETVRLCSDTQESRHITLSRPSSYPGLDKDFQIELQLRETRAREREAAAVMDTAAAIRQEAVAVERSTYERARVQQEERRDQEEQRRRFEREYREHKEQEEKRAREAAAQPPAAKPADPTPKTADTTPAYDSKDPKRPKGSKGWLGNDEK